MVVEHDLNFIRTADWIVELGPEAGIHGGELIFNGPVSEFLTVEGLSSPTLAELRKETTDLEERSASVSAEILQPQKGDLTVVLRKTSRILDRLQQYSEKENLKLQTVSDQPIGKTPRSNPATYTGLADKIRDLLAKSSEAKLLKLTKSSFSFNSKAGRCETCEGAGVITLSMNVMGSINQVCPACNGKRFKPEVLKVHWNGKNIADIYELSIEEARDFFSGRRTAHKNPIFDGAVGPGLP